MGAINKKDVLKLRNIKKLSELLKDNEIQIKFSFRFQDSDIKEFSEVQLQDILQEVFRSDTAMKGAKRKLLNLQAKYTTQLELFEKPQK